MGRQQSPLQKPNIHRFHQILQRLSVDTPALYQQLEIDPATMEDENASISMVKYLQLLELAAELSDNRFLGMDMSLENRNVNLGILSYMLNNAPNFDKALELLHRYVILVSPGSSTSLMEEGEDCILTYTFNDTPPSQCCQDVEGTISQFVLMIRTILQDESWQPIRLYFEHPAPNKDDLKRFPIHCELVFDHFFSGVRFSKELIQIPNRESDSQLLTLLEGQAQLSAQSLRGPESLLDHIRLLINSSLGIKEVTADTIAVELGMSRRTLNRRLSENGTTFNTVRENIVFHIAKESLSNSSTSITELAQKLGYSDSSAFNRAFKRLSGHRPLEYRKLHRPSLN